MVFVMMNKKGGTVEDWFITVILAHAARKSVSVLGENESGLRS